MNIEDEIRNLNKSINQRHQKIVEYRNDIDRINDSFQYERIKMKEEMMKLNRICDRIVENSKIKKFFKELKDDRKGN